MARKSTFCLFFFFLLSIPSLPEHAVSMTDSGVQFEEESLFNANCHCIDHQSTFSFADLPALHKSGFQLTDLVCFNGSQR